MPARVSAENGEIRPGDSLTPAGTPGVLMKADAGDPTVGVALEGFGGHNVLRSAQDDIGSINVLISRRISRSSGSTLSIVLVGRCL